MLTGVENWVRNPPVALPVLPSPRVGARSTTSTSRQPRFARCQATLAPMTPAPRTTTSGISVEPLRQPDPRELEAGVPRPEVAVARPDVVLRRGAGAAAQDADVVHELAVVLHQGSFERLIARVGLVVAGRPLPEVAPHLEEPRAVRLTGGAGVESAAVQVVRAREARDAGRLLPLALDGEAGAPPAGEGVGLVEAHVADGLVRVQ